MYCFVYLYLNTSSEFIRRSPRIYKEIIELSLFIMLDILNYLVFHVIYIKAKKREESWKTPMLPNCSSVVYAPHTCERVRTHTRDEEKKLRKDTWITQIYTVVEPIRDTFVCILYTCTSTRIHVNIIRVETWVIRADARVRARAFLRHPLFHFASLFTCQLLLPFLFPSLHV